MAALSSLALVSPSPLYSLPPSSSSSRSFPSASSNTSCIRGPGDKEGIIEGKIRGQRGDYRGKITREKYLKHRLFAVTSDDEWGEEPSPGPPDSPEESDEEIGGTAELKAGLIDNLFDTDRGLTASSETRAEIVELITQLEAKNPTPAPNESLPLLNGKWILAYTAFSELFPLLAAARLPLVKVGEISQFIDSDTLTIENCVSFTGPLATRSFSASATFEIRSPKRLQIKFEEGVIGSPQAKDYIEIPETFHFMGQKIDLTAFRGSLRSLEDAASFVARTLSGQPPLRFPIRSDRAQSWLLTTFLDEDIRISRGDGGSIFVLIKEGSPLLSPGYQ